MSSTPNAGAGRTVTFSQAFNPERNAFAFLRICLALLVIVTHSFHLGGFGDDPLARITASRHSFGEVGVGLFFALSGFLVTRSGVRLASIRRFLWHRVLRILPGYWMCLLLTAFFFAPCYAFLEYGAFFRVFQAPWDSPQSYVIRNSSLLHLNQFSIEGVMNVPQGSIAHLLHKNPYSYVVNGSLWSLPYEFAAYLLMGGLIAAGVMPRHRTVAVAVGAGAWALYAFERLRPALFAECFIADASPLILCATYFSAGCVCFLYRNEIPFSTPLLALCLGLLAGGLMLDAFSLVAPAALTYVFFWLGFKLDFTRFETIGDLSFGTYIYAFPVQQGLVLLYVHEAGFASYLICSVLATLGFAALSYHGVEAPCLRWKNVGRTRVIIQDASGFPDGQGTKPTVLPVAGTAAGSAA